MIEQIEQWLASKNVDLWANWRISDPERRREAAEWFYKQLDELGDFQANLPSKSKSWDVVQ